MAENIPPSPPSSTGPSRLSLNCQAQQLFLLDLPEEILELIFKYTDENGVFLGATCHDLRRIGGPQMHQMRIISMPRVPPSFLQTIGIRPPKSRQQFVDEVFDIFSPVSSHFKDIIKHLKNNPDIMLRLRYLHLDPTWLPFLRHMANTYRCMPKFSPRGCAVEILVDMTSMVLMSPNLVVLSLSNLEIDVSFAKALSKLQRLQEINFHRCSLTSDFSSQEQVLQQKYSCHRLTMTLMPMTDSQRLCRMISRCEDVQDVSIFPDSVELDLVFDSIEFHSPRRLHLSRLTASSILHLSQALAHPSHQNVLTHFKATFSETVADMEVIHLLDHLQQCPLQHFAIYGLEDSYPALFTDIAERLPNLTALIVQHYRGDWCSSPHEYAVRFSAFKHLRFFGWNYPTPPTTFSPWAMNVLTQDDPQGTFLLPYTQSDTLNDAVDEEDDCFCSPVDGYHMVSVFGAYCSSLRVMAMYTNETDVAACWTCNHAAMSEAEPALEELWNPFHFDF